MNTTELLSANCRVQVENTYNTALPAAVRYLRIKRFHRSKGAGRTGRAVTLLSNFLEGRKFKADYAGCSVPSLAVLPLKPEFLQVFSLLAPISDRLLAMGSLDQFLARLSWLTLR